MGFNWQWIVWLGVLFMACGTIDGAIVAFDKNYKPLFGQIGYLNSTNAVQLSLYQENGQAKGSGFFSRNAYVFGRFAMRIKFVPNDSAGIVVAFYLSSDGTQRDEIDFEFLGKARNVNDHLLQTNVYVGGHGDREQRVNLWFNPAENYHTYSILWNLYQIVFLVDNIPIRVFTNCKALGGKFPLYQQMKVYSTLWDADDWASNGGRDKINWGNAPFLAYFAGFNISDCNHNAYVCSKVKGLSGKQEQQLDWVHANRTTYNYCSDTGRNHGVIPPECHCNRDVY